MIIDDFTGHEHLLDFGLINMNGRMYDPLLSSFLSPDNYMQDPTCQQGFNRYAYCMYNPLKYIDPTGEQYLGWDSGRQYRMEQEMRGIILNFWHHCYDSALASHFATVAMANCLYGHGPETHGNGRGNHGSGGGDGVKIGSEAFKKLCEKLGIEPGKPIPKDKRTDAFLKEFQETFFPDMPMEYVLELSTHGYDFGKKDEGVTIAQQGNDLITGYSRVYFNEDYVFESPESMFYIMGHEFVHVSQNMELRGEDYSILNTTWMNDVKEYHAYQWDQDMGKRHYTFEWQSQDNNIFNYYNRLKYSNFYWLINIIHP